MDIQKVIKNAVRYAHSHSGGIDCVALSDANDSILIWEDGDITDLLIMEKGYREAHGAYITEEDGLQKAKNIAMEYLKKG